MQLPETISAIQPFQILWAIFSLGVLYSFAHLAAYQLKVRKPHIAAMALSYTLVVGCVTLPGNPYEDWRRWALVVALVFGVIGLINYYRGTVTE